MNNKIDESEQWLLSGNCSKCRRNNYCSKPCTRSKRATNASISSLVSTMMDEFTNGAYSEIMKHSKYR